MNNQFMFLKLSTWINQTMCKNSALIKDKHFNITLNTSSEHICSRPIGDPCPKKKVLYFTVDIQHEQMPRQGSGQNEQRRQTHCLVFAVIVVVVVVMSLGRLTYAQNFNQLWVPSNKHICK